MNTRTRTLIASLCILASGSAVANDAMWGALLGGGAGAAIGGSVSGRNGAIVGGAIGAAAGAVIASDSDRAHNRAAYRPQVLYHPAPPVYYAPPTRVVTPVYYVTTYRGERHPHHHHERWRREQGHWHDYR